MISAFIRGRAIRSAPRTAAVQAATPAATSPGATGDFSGLVDTGGRKLFLECRGQGRSFDRFTLNGASCVHATLEKTVFTGARLRDEPQFGSALMPGAVFTYEKLEQASFAGSALRGETLEVAALFDFAYVDNCDFTVANMFGVSFAGRRLSISIPIYRWSSAGSHWTTAEAATRRTARARAGHVNLHERHRTPQSSGPT